MKGINTRCRLFFVSCFLLFSHSALAQCFQIESILVDACGVQEGLNEMVRLKVGNAPLNTANLSVDWPNNPWQGLVQNATTASKVAVLNADILDAGGCGQLVEPTNGILPANATVILVTSFNFDTALNSFDALTETYYILFQNNPTTASGHFANSGTGVRTLSMAFGSCSDTVSYDRALLVDPNGTTVAADGAIVLFNPAGNPTYINNGCSAPVPPFTVDAGPAALNACAGATLSLTGTAQGQQSVSWTSTSGTFSNPNALNTNFTVPNNSGNLTLTLTATNSCGATTTDQIVIIVGNGIVPNFATTLTLCTGTTAPVLNPISPNGITGTWNPSTISNTASGSYVFTPNPNQCATSVTLQVTISNSIVPNFATTLTLCTGTTAPVLNPTSPNGITGTWNPSTISNTASGSYVFTPNPNQCATSVTLQVTISNSIVPNFATNLSLCTGATAPVLNSASPNGITGTWNPSTISNTASGSYIFTPNANQCAGLVTLQVTVSNSIVPNFATSMTLCTGATAPVLNPTSPNGITGTWTPSAISNTTSGSYVFTPNPNQCAGPVTLQVTVSGGIVPNFETTLTLCAGATAPILNTTSPNGITGSWNPPMISNEQSADYIFTPFDGQCASAVVLAVTVPVVKFEIEQYCKEGKYYLEVVPDAQMPATAQYRWEDSNGQFLGDETMLNVSDWVDPETVYPTNFMVHVFVPDACGTSRNVTVYSTMCTIPKGISPNGDGKNDWFDLGGMGVVQLRIFNRYGTEVYTKQNYSNQWSGQSGNGKELPDGTYYYAIELSDGQTQTGWVYLNR
ncbi:gliding motility-associated C-terminal domain-containing protein [Flavobacterium sp.]|uniref:T9SS type B sorting domain-containing protein n=1 Tax=Flavobacterium sp. TaxID=239 RepID=UPI0039E2286B